MGWAGATEGGSSLKNKTFGSAEPSLSLSPEESSGTFVTYSRFAIARLV